MVAPKASQSTTGGGSPQQEGVVQFAVVDSRLDGLESRLEDQDAAYARVEVLLGAFAVILTLLVIYLGWRVESSAIKAAAQKAKDELKSSETEIRDCVEKSKEVLNQAKAILRDIEGHKAMSSHHLEQIEQIHVSIAAANRKA